MLLGADPRGADPRTPARQIHQATGIEPVKDYITRGAEKFFAATSQSDNPLIRSITHAPRGKHPHVFEDIPGAE
ncbi:hypothetical protein QE152_g39530 [Popillia japonica]|uniref:Uncharacterized protein n=1 Tax=Popillia japonica TaxID=7064 RepID=A0AAW1HTR8_POPJA